MLNGRTRATGHEESRPQRQARSKLRALRLRPPHPEEPARRASRRMIQPTRMPAKCEFVLRGRFAAPQDEVGGWTPRPPLKTILHGQILNNPLAASKDLFKARLRNRERFRRRLVRQTTGAILAARAPTQSQGSSKPEAHVHTTHDHPHRTGRRPRLELGRRARPGQGHAEPQTAAPARRSRQPEAAGQGSVRPSADAGRSPGALDRLLLARLSCRSQGAPGRRRILAGRAPVAQSHVGQSGDDRLPRALLAQGEGRGRLERHSGRRHFPAARRPDADRPCLASGRPRRRYLAHPDAGPHALQRRARDHVGGRYGERGWALGHGALDAGAGRQSSRPRPRSRRSNGSSSMRRSKRPCARPRGASPG